MGYVVPGMVFGGFMLCVGLYYGSWVTVLVVCLLEISCLILLYLDRKRNS